MKKTIALLVFALVSMSAAHAQFFLGGIQLNHNKAHGIIYLNDGTEYEFGTVNIPRSVDATISARDADKQKHTYQGKDVRAVEIWNDKAPDKHWFLRYINYRGSTYAWAVVAAHGDYMDCYELAITYDVTKDGKISFVVDRNSVTTLIYHKNHTENISDNYFIAPTIINKKKASAFFGDDPVLTQQLVDKKLHLHRDAAYIVTNYNPNE